MFLDHIISILQFDVLSLFDFSCLSCSSPDGASTSGSSNDSVDENCILHVYEPRPTIVPECRCGCHHCPVLSDRERNPDTSRCDYTQLNAGDNVDVCSSGSSANVQVSAANSVCDLGTAGDASDATCCQSITQEIAEIVTNKRANSTQIELKVIEDRACELWNILNTGACDRNGNIPQWWDLKSWQKLPFYWAALSNEILSDDPFENFKRFFVLNIRRRRQRESKQENKRVLNMWRGLCIKQRAPFIMEAFIAKVSFGKINTHDDREIQKAIKDLYSK